MATTQEALRRTNEQPGTRAKLRNLRTSAYKVRQVLNLIRGKDVQSAKEILEFCERGPAEPIAKLLDSAIANATHNDGLDEEDLFVSACFADEGVTMKRFKAGSRGRSGKIFKRTSHITLIVGRLPEDKLERLRTERSEQEGSRRQRVAGSRSKRVAAAKAVESKSVAETEVHADDAPVTEEPVVDSNGVAEEVVTEASADETTKSNDNDSKEEK